jgi:energy-coupling factor transporter ATP-binding protein EcfA2
VRGIVVKINRLEIENVKRVKAVKIEPTKDGLTVIGGRNGQGKTSVLDAIAWALGGERYRPSQPQRDGSVLPPDIHIVLDNGMVVERKGKNSSLKVTLPGGDLSGQKMLDSFVSQLALDLPKFLQASDREKGDTLLRVIGVGDKLAVLDRQEKELYDKRRTIGQIAEQKCALAEGMPYYPDAPAEPVSASELIHSQQEILARNGENQRKRQNVANLAAEEARLARELEVLQAQYKKVCADLEIARKSAEDLEDESTEALENDIAQIETINRKVRCNLDKDKAQEDAKGFTDQYDRLTVEIEKIRTERRALLDSAKLPLPGLTVEDGALKYNGYRWDNLSGSDQLRVATAIVRALNPRCGFVLLDKLEQMDVETMRDFGAWLEGEGLQAIATRVSTGEECSIIITDGYVENTRADDDQEQPAAIKFKAGEF